MGNLPTSDDDTPPAAGSDPLASWAATAREATLILTQGVSHWLPWLLWWLSQMHGIR